MKTCSECKLKYPDEVISKLVTSNGNIPECCPLCAAHIVYGWTGSKKSPFAGKGATHMFDIAIVINGERWKQRAKS